MSTGENLITTPSMTPVPGRYADQRYSDALRLLLEDARSPQTRRAYASDLRDFFAEAGLIGQGETVTAGAVRSLCSLTTPALALALNDYKGRMIGRGLSESTVNRRLAAVRSLLRMARRLGADVPDPAGLVSGERVTAYRDTRGPAVADVVRLLAAPDRTTTAGRRDYALLVLLAENALRRAEVCSLDVSDFDPKERRLLIRGKGMGTQKAPVTLSEVCADAITAYLSAWRRTDGPLFTGETNHLREKCLRLTADGLYHVLQRYGRQVLGRDLHPHSLRHAAITAALDATGGDVRRAQRLSRHADVRTLQRYDDNRADLQGEVTGLLSAIYQTGVNQTAAKEKT